MNDQPKFDDWALVELLGRNRIVGRASETTIAGGAFLRVDVPECNGQKAFTRFYSAASIYCISPIAEDVARSLIVHQNAAPVQRYELPALAEKVKEGAVSQEEMCEIHRIPWKDCDCF